VLDGIAEWSAHQMENESGLGLSGGIKSLGYPHTHAAPGTAIILPGRASLALRYHCELPSQRGQNLAAIGADYFLIQDLPGYQGMLDTGTAALNFMWEGRLHTG
jgi:hypothetical protein